MTAALFCTHFGSCRSCCVLQLLSFQWSRRAMHVCSHHDSSLLCCLVVLWMCVPFWFLRFFGCVFFVKASVWLVSVFDYGVVAAVFSQIVHCTICNSLVKRYHCAVLGTLNDSVKVCLMLSKPVCVASASLSNTNPSCVASLWLCLFSRFIWLWDIIICLWIRRTSYERKS